MGNLIEATFDKLMKQQMSAMKPGSPPLYRELSDKESKSLRSGDQGKGILFWDQFLEAFAKGIQEFRSRKVRPQVHQPEGGDDCA